MTTPLFLSYVGFFAMSLLALAGALIAVSQQNLVRAALGLILAFLGVAGIYFMLEAEFVGSIGAVAHTRFLHGIPPHKSSRRLRSESPQIGRVRERLLNDYNPSRRWRATYIRDPALCQGQSHHRV